MIIGNTALITFTQGVSGFGAIGYYGFILQCEFLGVGHAPPCNLLSEVAHHAYQELL